MIWGCSLREGNRKYYHGLSNTIVSCFFFFSCLYNWELIDLYGRSSMLRTRCFPSEELEIELTTELSFNQKWACAMQLTIHVNFSSRLACLAFVSHPFAVSVVIDRFRTSAVRTIPYLVFASYIIESLRYMQLFGIPNMLATTSCQPYQSESTLFLDFGQTMARTWMHTLLYDNRTL